MYPDDIDPESGCRLPLPRRDELSAAGQEIYDRLANPSGGNLRGLRGPGGIQLHSPELSQRSRPLNHYLRFEAGLGGRVRELAILTVARELDSQFEWAAHEAEALRKAFCRILSISFDIAAISTGWSSPTQSSFSSAEKYLVSEGFVRRRLRGP